MVEKNVTSECGCVPRDLWIVRAAPPGGKSFGAPGRMKYTPQRRNRRARRHGVLMNAPLSTVVPRSAAADGRIRVLKQLERKLLLM